MDMSSIGIWWLITLKNPNCLQPSTMSFLALGSSKSTTGSWVKMWEVGLHVWNWDESETTGSERTTMSVIKFGERVRDKERLERETGMWFSEEMCGGIYTVKEGRLSRKE